MRDFVAALLVTSAALAPRIGRADESPGSQLFGSWRLVSYATKVVGEERSLEPFGPHPFGRLILLPSHHMCTFISKPDRSPPTNDAEAAALLSSMIAYTGRFKLEGDKFTTKVDGAWNEILKANEQVRYFAVRGDTLRIRTPEQASAVFPGKRVVTTLVWEREK